MSCTRRAALLGAAGLVGCGAMPTAPDASVSCTPLPEGAQTIEVKLADLPELRTPGSFAIVERPEALMNVWVHHDQQGCFSAVWHLCTHGACEVEVREAQGFECPCHGSQFALDGSVIKGPATRPLRAFAVERRGDSLFISTAR